MTDKSGSRCETREDVKRLFEEHPPGQYHDIVKVGIRALENDDLVLAAAAADHVLGRAPTGSGDSLRAMALQAMMYEKRGKQGRADTLYDTVIRRKF